MELLVQLLTVFGLGAVELWVAIPAGFAMNLPPSVTAITAASGAILGLLGPLLIGAPLGTVLGIAMGLQVNRIFFWMCLGIMVCSIGLTIVTEFGFKSIWYFLQF